MHIDQLYFTLQSNQFYEKLPFFRHHNANDVPLLGNGNGLSLHRGNGISGTVENR